MQTREIRIETWLWHRSSRAGVCGQAAHIHAPSRAWKTGRFSWTRRERRTSEWMMTSRFLCKSRRKSIVIVDASAGFAKRRIWAMGSVWHGTLHSLQAENGKCQVTAFGSRGCGTYIMYCWAPMYLCAACSLEGAPSICPLILPGAHFVNVTPWMTEWSVVRLCCDNFFNLLRLNQQRLRLLNGAETLAEIQLVPTECTSPVGGVMSLEFLNCLLSCGVF